MIRADPPFPLPRLRVREVTAEIRDHRLRVLWLVAAGLSGQEVARALELNLPP